MTTKAIRILDKINNIVNVELFDFLKEISYVQYINWAILYLDAIGHLSEDTSIIMFMEQINKSENGLLISGNDLILLSNKPLEIIDIIIIGCENANLLHRYETKQEMYQTVDIVIQMIDSSFWEVFSKDEKLIDRYIEKFENVVLL